MVKLHLVNGDLIGSTLLLPGENNKASSVTMAYWSGTGGNFHKYDISHKYVGEVQVHYTVVYLAFCKGDFLFGVMRHYFSFAYFRLCDVEEIAPLSGLLECL